MKKSPSKDKIIKYYLYFCTINSLGKIDSDR